MEEASTKSTEYISTLYSNVGYFDMYSHSVLLFILLTCIVIFAAIFSHVILRRSEIASNWAVERCKPMYLPFAGYINNPTADRSNFEYTGDNFQFCVQEILLNIAGSLLQPFQYLITGVTDQYNSLGETMNATRAAVNNVRSGFSGVVMDVLSRFLNMLIPFQHR